MRADGVLYREKRRHFVVFENYLSRRVNDEADVEEAVLQVRMAGFGLGHDEGVVLARDLA